VTRPAGARGVLRVIDGGMVRNDPVARLHQFQGEHPEVQFTAPRTGGRGRYLALIPPGTIPGESREITVTAIDLTGLMDELADKFGSPPD